MYVYEKLIFCCFGTAGTLLDVGKRHQSGAFGGTGQTGTEQCHFRLQSAVS